MVGGRERLRAWTLMDELVLDVYAMTRKPSADVPEDLGLALRGAAVRATLKIVQGAHVEGEGSILPLRSALGLLAELRYYLYLARRLGLIDLRRYRGACARHEKAQACLRQILSTAAEASAAAAPGGVALAGGVPGVGDISPYTDPPSPWGRDVS